MDSIIRVINTDTKTEQEFDLINEIEEIEEFLNDMEDNYTIVSISDNYGFFKDLNITDTTIEDITELVELLENDRTEIKENCIKLKYYFENNSVSIKNLVSDYNDIIDTHTYFTDCKTSEKWLENHFEEYSIFDINNWENVARNFDTDLRDKFLSDLFVSVDFGEGYENLLERFYTMDTYDIFSELNDICMFQHINFNLSNFIDWENMVKDLWSGGFYIDTFENGIIVHSC